MSIFELIFVALVAFGIIPNRKLIGYYKKITSFNRSKETKRDLIGDDSVHESWQWIEDEETRE